MREERGRERGTCVTEEGGGKNEESRLVERECDVMYGSGKVERERGYGRKNGAAA